MRIAFVSDVHANLQAWNAVHADMAALKVDKVICLGDIVGYGPSPAEVLTRVYANVHHFVLGNHDAVVGGLMAPTGFNPHARRLIAHTCEQLGDKAKTFFSKVPLAIKCKHFRCTHGNPAHPGSFGYLVKEPEARAAWKLISEELCFIGHTHRPCLHVLFEDGQYTRLAADGKPVRLEPGRRYIVNCGSVGMSRDQDFRACYVVYDAAVRSLQWHWVAYDLQAFTQNVREVYGDTDLGEFLLRRFDAKTPQPVREMIDFTPGTAAVSESVAREEEIEAIKAKAARWKLVAGVAFLLFLLVTAGFLLFWRSLPAPKTITAEKEAPILMALTPDDFTRECVPVEPCPSGRVPPGWKVVLGDSRTQSVSFPGRKVVLSSADNTQGMELALPRVELSGIDKIRIKIHGSVSVPFGGEGPTLVLDYLYENGQARRGVRNEPLVLSGGDLSKQHTVSGIPGDVVALQIRLRGRFSGRMELDAFTLMVDIDPAKPAGPASPVNINRATARELSHLPGIGEATAQKIVEHREKNGPFRRLDDLLQVKGIGKATLSKIEQHVRLGE